MRLAAVGIAKGDVDTGKLFVLKQDADHFGQSKIGSEGQLADAVAVFVGVAIVPEFLPQVLALALYVHEPRGFDGEGEGCGLKIAILTIEVIARSGVADKSAVYG